ncbi:MAG: transposase [Bacteroidales bacterium]|nr:transposase [Bacteroidales bacterium]
MAKYPGEVKGWRKIHDWYRRMKNAMRAVGKASSSGGRNKEDRIGHEEKVFSIFEEYTEWVTKGKLHPNVELGKKLSITTDQYHLIVDYRIMENHSDSEVVKPIVEDMTEKYNLRSWSFDKGYWHKDNKALLEEHVERVVMPKKGKPNKQEKEEEGHRQFKLLRNKHSAVESNINELENRGLDRCPDRGYMHFKRYVGLAISAYNLRRIGQKLIEIQRKRELAERELRAAA